MASLNFPGKEFIHKNEWTSLLALVGFLLAGYFLAQFASYVVMGIYFGFDLSKLQQLMADPYHAEGGRFAFLLLQGVSSLLLFIVVPFAYIYLFERGDIKQVFVKGHANIGLGLFITFFLILAYMPMSAYTVQWNESVKFPDGLELVEEIMRNMEDQLAKLTKFLIDFDGPFEFLLGLLVIALLPGVGEELLFRGVLQNKIHQLSKNPHLAIWLSAFIFSAIHLQFYGLVPRMLLGALFGYLYIWSGTLLVPMFAHFLNNGYTLTAVYLNSIGLVEVDLENTEVSIQAVLFSLVLTSGLLWVFRMKQAPNSKFDDLE